MAADLNDVDALDIDIGRLVADACLLQRHLADSGKLADTALGDAIDALCKARGTPDAAKYLALLSVEYSKHIHLNGEISIADLRTANEVLYRDRWMSIREAVTASVAIVLILFAVLGFVVVQDLNDNIAQLQLINLQNPLQKLTELRRLIDEKALDDPKSAVYLQYLKARHEVVLMFDSANRIMQRTEASSRRSRVIASDGQASGGGGDDETGIVTQIYNVILFELIGPPALTPPNPLPAGSQPPYNAASYAAAAASSGSYGKAASAPAEAYSGGTLEGIYDTSKKSAKEGDCKPYNDQPVRDLVGLKKEQLLKVALDRFDDFCLAQTLDIQMGSYRPATAIHTVHVLQDQLFMIGVLFLPLVGGLLGATISIIYAIINNTRSAQLSAGYMAVRIAVGGAFGVIIGWFSATGAGGSANSIPHVSGTPFTLAVLAGFSVQTLSAVLMTFSASLERQNTGGRAPRTQPETPSPAPAPNDRTDPQRSPANPQKRLDATEEPPAQG